MKIADFGIASAQALRRGAGRAQGQVRLHVARAGARREGRPAERPLRARRHPLGDPRRPAAPRRARRRGAARHRALGHRRAAEHVRRRTSRRELEAIVMRALAPTREERFQTGREHGGGDRRGPSLAQAGARRRVDARGDDRRSSSRARTRDPGERAAAAPERDERSRRSTRPHAGRRADGAQHGRVARRASVRGGSAARAPHDASRRARRTRRCRADGSAPPTGRARCATSPS